MRGNLESRLRELEDSMPRGYTTFDSQGRPIIHSLVTGLQWFKAACDLFDSPGRDEEKELMRQHLAASVGQDNGGGYLYQLIEAMADGPVETKPDATR
jgi:hypothetical protein